MLQRAGVDRLLDRFGSVVTLHRRSASGPEHAAIVTYSTEEVVAVLLDQQTADRVGTRIEAGENASVPISGKSLSAASGSPY